MSPNEHRLARHEPGYPGRLAGLGDSPSELYVRGTWRDESLSVAIVGSRAASGLGIGQARDLAAALGESGAQIISGGALGIDAAAHRGALAAGAHTAAVLAGGLDNLYPARNRPLFTSIIAAEGALVTPYQRGVPPKGFHFVHRNRVIAALADIVVVVDCRLGSGALYTAQAALKYGRPVAAVPGSEGCEALIAQGAAVVTEAADVLAALAGRPRRPEVELPSAGSEGAIVLAALAGDDPRDEDDLSELTGLAARKITRALSELELAGLAVVVPGPAYLRSQTAEQALAD